MVAGRADDVALVDAFLAQDKFLSGAPPEFGPKVQKGKHPSLWDATWPVVNNAGIGESGKICVNYAPASDKPFSISLVFRAECIMRLDFVSPTICHSNPHWAKSLGVASEVCGPHIHPWALNRNHILSQWLWDLPCRAAIQPQIRRFDQAFPWFAEQVNLDLGENGRSFDLPRELV